MIRQVFILSILISLIVISQGYYDNIVSSIVDGTQQKTNITCLCTSDEQCDSNTSTCRLTHPEHACYESWSKLPYDNIIHLTAGCVHNDFFFTHIVCDGNQSDRYIICCSDKDYCNDRDAYSSDIRKKLLTPNKRTRDNRFKYKLILIIIISFVLAVVFLIISILCHIKRKRNNEPTKNLSVSNWFCPRSKSSTTSVVKIEEYPGEVSGDSSAGTNAPLLAPYHFAKQISLEEKIGVGGYGCVYRGKWNGDLIAVKIFISSEENSWKQEVSIYKDDGLNHENILRYIAADNIDICDRIELWLATEYHSNGSVYDYLTNHTITIPIMIKMMYSIASGLCYLHLQIHATKGKVALAHRDLKTKNILVKKDLSCCIADLGLAVREERQIRNNNQESIDIKINPNHRVGTIRYMAPEVLNKTLNEQTFESYKATDLYALGLVFWEILRRCRTPPDNDVDVYQLPYEDILPTNPSFEQMHDVVCIRKIRPLPSPRWEKTPFLLYIFGLCEELWAEKPACRPNSYIIKEQLIKRFESINSELSNTNTESRNEGPQTV